MQQWPTQTQAEDRSEPHTTQCRSRSVLSRDLRRCRLSQFSCARLNPWRCLVEGRLPICISSHCPMHHQCSRMASWTLDTRAPDNKPVPVNFPTKILRLRAEDHQRSWCQHSFKEAFRRDQKCTSHNTVYESNSRGAAASTWKGCVLPLRKGDSHRGPDKEQTSLTCQVSHDRKHIV